MTVAGPAVPSLPDPEEAAMAIPPVTGTAPHIALIAGEPSGDALGAELMTALRGLFNGPVRMSGVGGEAMRAGGLDTIFGIEDTAVMGAREVIPALPRIFARIGQAADYILTTEPDVTVLIDSSGFTNRIAARVVARKPDLRLVKYVAPQVWASRPGRARSLAGLVDCVMTLLPFEPDWFLREGLPARFVGHPVVERAAQMKGGPAFRDRHGIATEAPVLALLPGSRSNEIRFLLPAFRETVSLLSERVTDLQVVLPVVSHVSERVARGLEGFDVPVHMVEQDEKFAAFHASQAALAASGTVTTELAVAGVPMVVAYRIGWLTDFIYRKLVKVPFITLINIIEGRSIIPEFIQESVDPVVMADELERLFTEPEAAQRQLTGQRAALARMGMGGDSPSLRAARVVVEMLSTPPSPTKLARAKASGWF